MNTHSDAVPAEPITTAADRSRACPCMCHEGGPETDHGPRLANGDSGRYAYRRDSRADLHDDEAPASQPVPAPVLLTADDPRWRDGAKVRGEFADGSAAEGFVSGNFVNVSHDINGCAWPRRVFTAVYLIAAAPDPDADTLEVLNRAYNDQCNIGEMLDEIRAAGYDVVKRADS